MMFLTNLVSKVNKLVVSLLLGVVFCAACGPSASADAPVQITAVTHYAALTLDNGETIRLGHLYLGKGAVDYLREYMVGKPLDLQIVGTDRYGVKQVILTELTSGKTLQQMLLKRGLAVVYSEDIKADLSQLWQHEQADARIWPKLQADAVFVNNGFGLVEGVVHNVVVFKTMAYVNFGADWKSDFTILIPADVLRNMNVAQLEALRGKNVRARGMIHPYYGPRITLFRPDMMEVVDAPE